MTAEDEPSAPTCLSLFSGVGGLDEGLRRAGFRHVLMCESDSYRRDVLRARFPGVPIADDVRHVAVGEPAGRAAADGCGAPVDGRGRQAGAGLSRRVHLVAGGSPCQDLSVAGQRRGLDGNRSGLFYEMARVIDAVRPRWVLWENVPGAFSSQGGRDFGAVLGTLADLGYGLAWRTLDSRFFGVPQRRRRVYVVGALADDDPRAAAERAGEVLAVGSRCGRHPATRGEAREDLAGTLGGGSGSRGWASDVERMTFIPHVANPLLKSGENKWDDTLSTYVASTMKSQRGKGGGGIGPEETLIAETVRSHPRPGSNSNGNLVAPALVRRYGKDTDSDATDAMVVAAPPTSVRRLTPTECERLQAFPDGWTDLGGTPDSPRYAALGDAVTVNVAHWIGARMLAASAVVDTGAPK